MRTMWIVLVVMMLAACCERVRPTAADSDSFLGLASFTQREALVDADAAFAAGDKRYWAYHDRAGLQVPGMSVSGEAPLHRLAPEMGDTIISDQHHIERQQFLRYAERYNQRLQTLQAP